MTRTWVSHDDYQAHAQPIGILESDRRENKTLTLTVFIPFHFRPFPREPETMPLSAIFNSLRRVGERGGERPGAYQANTSKLLLRFWEVVVNFWDLGFTAFGGPPVHFQILRRRFVDEEENGRIPWIDEQTVSLIVLIGSFCLAQSLMMNGYSTKSYSQSVKLSLAQGVQRWRSV